jgi:hypothetical protein
MSSVVAEGVECLKIYLLTIPRVTAKLPSNFYMYGKNFMFGYFLVTLFTNYPEMWQFENKKSTMYQYHDLYRNSYLNINQRLRVMIDKKLWWLIPKKLKESTHGVYENRIDLYKFITSEQCEKILTFLDNLLANEDFFTHTNNILELKGVIEKDIRKIKIHEKIKSKKLNTKII